MSADQQRNSAQSDPGKKETWQKRLENREIEFADLVRLKYWRGCGTPKLVSLGREFYEPALAVFRTTKHDESVAAQIDTSIGVNVAIFEDAGCGVYLPPDGRFWYIVIERAIGFDWSAAQLLMHRLDRLARHSRELWRTDLSLLPKPEASWGGLRRWLLRRRCARRVARRKNLVAERGPHCERAYELCSSVFSAVNLETLDRKELMKAGRTLSRSPSNAFRRRVDLVRPEVDAAEAAFRKAAQRYAQGRYGRGMLMGVAVIIVMCAALAAVFSSDHVPAWYGVALLSGGLGAIVSVLQRMASGRLRLDYDAGRGMLIVLGAVRPLIGAVFGMVLFAAVDGGWLPSLQVSQTHALAFYAVLGFLAGFNERFAQDMLVASAAQLGGDISSESDPSQELLSGHAG